MTDNVVQLPLGKPKGLPELPMVPVMEFTGKDGSVQNVEITQSEATWYMLIMSKIAEYRNAVRWFVVSNPQIMHLDVRRMLEMRIPRAHFEAFTASFDFTYVMSVGSIVSEEDFTRIQKMEHCEYMDETRLEKMAMPYAVYLLPTDDPDTFELLFAEL
jgi:hypothetical protein